MKKFLPILFIVLPLLACNVAVVNAQSISSGPASPTVFFCVGDNPQPPCATIAPTQAPPISPTTVVSTKPTEHQNEPTGDQNNPSPSQTTNPTTTPCSTSNQSVSAQNTGSSNHGQSTTKIHASGKHGFLQQLIQMLLQIIMLLLQQLGAQLPGSGGTGTPCPTTGPSVAPSSGPSSAPSSGVSQTPSAGVSPSAAVSPTTEPTPTSAPSPTVAVSPSAGPSSTPSSSPSNGAVSPTQEQSPSVTPAPTSGGIPAWLQQLLQMILQLLQLIAQHLGINPCNGTACPQPTSGPSTAPSNPATSPTSGVSPTPSSSPSEAPTPTIFNTTPTPTPTPTINVPSGVTLAPTTFFTPSPSSASPSPATVVTTGLLKSDVGNICADDFKQSTANNNQIDIWGCNSNDKGQIFSQYSDNTIRFGTNKCLDVTKNATTNGTLVELFDCNGNQNQQWVPTTITSGAASGLTELVSPASGKCLDDKASSTTNGTQLEIFTCNGGKNQAWSWTNATITPKPTTCTPVPTCKPVAGKVCPNIVNNCHPTSAPKTAKLLASGLSGGKAVCLDDFQNRDLNNTNAVIWKCDAGDAGQQWTANSDGTIRIHGKCLDVLKSKTANDTTLDLFTCNGGSNQKWTAKTITSGAAKGKQELVSAASNKCMDVKAGKTANQTQVEIFTCNGGLNQAWSWTNFTSGGSAL